MQKLGVAPQLLAGGDIYPALERGTVCGTTAERADPGYSLSEYCPLAAANLFELIYWLKNKCPAALVIMRRPPIPHGHLTLISSWETALRSGPDPTNIRNL